MIGLTLTPAVAHAAPMDGSVPLLCSVATVVECSRKGECERSTAEEAQVPPFVSVNVPPARVHQRRRHAEFADHERPAHERPAHASGMQNERVWGAVIDEATGRIMATVGEHDGAIVISGACIAP